MSRKPIVVQKYGGSSVADPEKILAVARHIQQTAKTNQVAVIVSAMGDSTDEIIAKMEAVNPKPLAREMDQALHTGEILSAAMMASALVGLGCKARSMTGQQMRLIAGGTHRCGRIIGIEEADEMKRLLAEGEILVCAGFQGVNPTNEIVTLGRGGSDTSAVALAHVLEAAACEIYTDVDGVYTVDPRTVPQAKRFSFITYSDMLAMSAAGAGVLMDRSVLMAQIYNVPLRVLISPSKGRTTGGTLVSDRPEDQQTLEDDTTGEIGLAIRKKVAVVTISNIADHPGMTAEIFSPIKDIMIGDAVQGKTGETASISFWVDAENTDAISQCLNNWSPQIDTSCVCLTLTGSGMKEGKGYLAGVCRSLGQTGVNIRLMSTSGTSILVIIAEADLPKAAQAIAQEFDLCG